MVKMNFSDRQVALDYAIYMIVGSYFKAARLSSPILERNMRVQYFEQKLDYQYRLEDACINYIEKKVVPYVPEEIWDREMIVKIVTTEDETIVCFQSDAFELRIKGEFMGKRTKLSYVLYASQDNSWLKLEG